MSLLQRVLSWRRAQAEDRKAAAAARRQGLRAGDRPEEAAVEGVQEIMDAGIGAGFTPEEPPSQSDPD